jgi:hypothetical protein
LRQADFDERQFDIDGAKFLTTVRGGMSVHGYFPAASSPFWLLRKYGDAHHGSK